MEKHLDSNLRIVFFDGVCHLCNSFVDGVIIKDKNHLLYFAPLQGETAQKVLSQKETANLDSIIFFDAGRIYYRSDAVINILSYLEGPPRYLRMIRFIPRVFRDFIYKGVAKTRYTLFGKSEVCRLAKPEEKKYLLP